MATRRRISSDFSRRLNGFNARVLAAVGRFSGDDGDGGQRMLAELISANARQPFRVRPLVIRRSLDGDKKTMIIRYADCLVIAIFTIRRLFTTVRALSPGATSQNFIPASE